MNSTADVVVVGGGIIGLSTAFELASDGLSVALVEKDDFGRHQSRQNWGFIRQQGRGHAELPLIKHASTLWPGLSDRLGAETGWVQGGNLAVFSTPQQRVSYRDWLHTAHELGVSSEFVSEEDIARMIPHWSRTVLGGIFAREDGQADPDTVVAAYIEACRRAGVRLHPRTAVSAIETERGRVTGVRTTEGAISTNAVVVAAGAWSRQLLKRVGVDLPQTYVNATVALTTPAPPVTRTTVWGPGFAFRQRTDGRFICSAGGNGTVDIGLDVLAQSPAFLGAFGKNWKKFRLRPERRIVQEIVASTQGKTAAEIGPPAPRPHARDPHVALARLKQSINGLDDLRLETYWAGVIDSTPDAQPIIDNRTGVEGLTLVTGFTGHGFGLAPATAVLAAELVRGGAPSMDISALRFGRFAEKEIRMPDAII